VATAVGAVTALIDMESTPGHEYAEQIVAAAQEKRQWLHTAARIDAQQPEERPARDTGGWKEAVVSHPGAHNAASASVSRADLAGPHPAGRVLARPEHPTHLTDGSHLSHSPQTVARWCITSTPAPVRACGSGRWRWAGLKRLMPNRA
jgi:hypothetical protein